MQTYEAVPPISFEQFRTSLIAHLKKNLPTTILFAVIGALVAYGYNIYKVAKTYEGTGTAVPQGSILTSGSNMMWGIMFWIFASSVVFGVLGHWKSVGTEQFLTDVRNFPNSVGDIFRSDGRPAWVHLLWGFAGSMVLTQILAPSLRGVFAVGVIMTIPSVLGRVVMGYISKVWTQMAARLNPGKQQRPVPLVAPAVTGFGAAAAMLLGMLINDTSTEFALAGAAALGAFALQQTSSRGNKPSAGTMMALLWITLVVVGMLAGASEAVADDGGFAECGTSWGEWWDCEGSDAVRSDALRGAIAGGVGAVAGASVGPALMEAARNAATGGLQGGPGTRPASGGSGGGNQPPSSSGGMTMEVDNGDGTRTVTDVAGDGTTRTRVLDQNDNIISETIEPRPGQTQPPPPQPGNNDPDWWGQTGTTPQPTSGQTTPQSGTTPPSGDNDPNWWGQPGTTPQPTSGQTTPPSGQTQPGQSQPGQPQPGNNDPNWWGQPGTTQPPTPQRPLFDADGDEVVVNDGTWGEGESGQVWYPDPATGEEAWIDRSVAEDHIADGRRLNADADRAMQQSIAAHDRLADTARQRHLAGLRTEAAQAATNRAQEELDAAAAIRQLEQMLEAARRQGSGQSDHWRADLEAAIARGDTESVRGMYRDSLDRSMTASRQEFDAASADARLAGAGEVVAQGVLNGARAAAVVVGGPLGLPATAAVTGAIGAAGGAAEGVVNDESAAQIAARTAAGFAAGVKDAGMSRLGGAGYGTAARAAATGATDAVDTYVQGRLNGQTHDQAAQSAAVSGTIGVLGEPLGDAVDALSGPARAAAQTLVAGGTGAVQSVAEGGTAIEGAGQGVFGALTGQLGGRAAGSASGLATGGPPTGGSPDLAQGARPEFEVDGTVEGQSARPAGQTVDPETGRIAGGTYEGEGYRVGAERSDTAIAASDRLGANGRGEVYGPNGRRVLEVLPNGSVVDGQNRPIDLDSVRRNADGHVVGYDEPNGSRVDLDGESGPIRTTSGDNPTTEPANLLTARGLPENSSRLAPETEAQWRSLGAGQAETVRDPVTGQTTRRAPLYGSDGRTIGHVDDSGRITNVNGAEVDPNSIETRGGRVTQFDTTDGTRFTTAEGGQQRTDLERAGGNRGSFLADDEFVRGLPSGAEIPDGRLHETGTSTGAVRALGEVAREGYTTTDVNGNTVQRPVRIAQRTTNMDSMAQIRDGNAVPKPMDVKSKTIKFEDTLLARNLGVDDIGKVGFLAEGNILSEVEIDARLDSLNLPDAERARLRGDVMDQRAARVREAGSKAGDMAALERSGFAVVDANGVVNTGPNYGNSVEGQRTGAGGGRPFAGDIDGVYVVDAETGRPVSYDQYQEVLGRMMNSDAQTQHGVETMAGQDVARATTGLVPGDPGYRAAVQEHTRRLGFLETAQRNNNEVSWEVGPDGVPRRAARLNSLDPDQVIGGPRFVPTAPRIGTQGPSLGSQPPPVGPIGTSDLTNIARGNVNPSEPEQQPEEGS